MWKRTRAAALLVLLPGCFGLSEITPSGGKPLVDPSSPAPAAASPSASAEVPLPWAPNASNRFFTCDATLPRASGRAAVRRLSRSQLERTLASLVGPALYADAGIRGRAEGLPSDVTQRAGDFSVATPPAWASTLFAIAQRVAELGLANAAWRAERLGACTNTRPFPDSCVEAAVRAFGARVYRRPLGADEVTSLLDTYRARGGQEAGLAALLRRLLQAPPLAFHVEEGTPLADGRVRLGDFEVASRLSYLLTDDMPDDALSRAAAEGRLRTVEDLRREAGRLLASDAGKARVRDFFRFYTHLTSAAEPYAGLAGLSQLDLGGFGAVAKTEALDFAEAVFWRGGTFAELMTSTTTRTSSPTLQAVLGAPAGVAGAAFSSPRHPGLLHRPALLTAAGPRTSPIVRGAHVRTLFLCDALGTPDPAVVASAQEQLGNTDGLSNRARTEQLTGAPACAGCHAAINPLGYAFEGYDGLGRPRTEEQVPDADGQVVATFPIDTTLSTPNLEEGGPTWLADSVALVEALAQSPKAKACFVRRAFEHLQLRGPTVADGCALADAEARIHAGSLEEALLGSVVNEDLFYRLSP